MRVRVAVVALPMWGSSTVCGAASSRGCTSGSRSNTSRPGREDRPLLERDRERLFVDDRAARRVHEHRGRSHEPELARADEVTGRVGERDVQAHDVGLGEQAVEVADPAR